MNIAYFISPHGFGHASRSMAVMEEIHRLKPDTRFEIFTLVPEWFFNTSLSLPFGYHPELTDIGLIQKTPFIEDMDGTVNRLNTFLPFKSITLKRLINTVIHLGCEMIICDISPLGIAVAKEMGIPSILIENFTWDWIYEGYHEHINRLKRHIDYLKEIYNSADYHIQTEPICKPLSVDLKTPPVSRRIRRQPDEIKDILNIPSDARMVMITISGVTNDSRLYLNGIKDFEDVFFVIQGISTARRDSNLISLSQDSDIFHPDLVNASDVTIGKLGYSTVAEVYHAGVPFGYIRRKRFRESARLEEFCKDEMGCSPISEEEFTDGRWLSVMLYLFKIDRVKQTRPNGAGIIADFILNIMKGANK